MATESPIRMPETSGKWAPHKKASGFVPQSSSNNAAEELKILLKSHRFTGNGKDSAPNRSGSAPPSMEGSFLAVGNVLLPQQSYGSLDFSIGKYESEEQLRADPAYLDYYSANVNLNPRLPPPLTSPEDRWRVRHVGAYGNNKNNNNNSNSGWVLASEDDSGNVSLRLSQGSLPTHEEEPEDDQAQAPLQQQQPPSDSLVDRTRENLSVQQKVVGGDSQEDFCSRSPSLVYNERSVLTNRVAEDSADRDSGSSSLYNSPVNNPSVILPSMGADNVPSSSTDQSSPPAASFSRDRSGGSSSRQSGINNATSRMKALTIIPIPIQEQQFHQNNPNNFPQNKIHHHHQHQHQQGNLYQTSSGKSLVNNPYISVDQSMHAPSKLSAEVQPVLQSSGFTPPLYASAAAFMTTAASPYYSNIQAPGFFSAPYLSGYTLSPNSIPPYVSGYPPPGTVPFVVDGTAGPSINPQTPGISTASNVPPGAEIHHQNMNKFYGQLGFPLQPSFVDPMYVQYPRQHFGEPYGVQGPFDPMTPRGGFMGGQVSLTESKKGFDNNVYMDEHKIHHPRNTSPGNLNARRGQMNPNYLGNSPNVGLLMQYQNSPLQSPALPGVFPGSPGASPGLSRGRAEMRFSPAPGRSTGMYSGWPARRGFEGFEDPKIYNFLEELKSGKGRRFELSDITGHIVEFSSDQHGSRFIQQKLENCSVEEKASVFKEVLPHAPRLMTDVFGNYVIQKFFEYGSPDQRKELAKQLTGQILTLSLQMYGCRVIQKALEVIELDQKAQLVHELDGHVMRCVRDQNGNHVIQKCIESIPTDKIGFIISAFRGQVATLSMHPYGCRVIQRVLEHCTDEVQCQFIIDEILESARTLAQDQYGNYVTQHVLERGQSEERRQIISKLSGHIVQLSQHKFASNVIEKCLEHGSPADQEIIINEIVGQDEGNDNLLTMMKDQFANYVVQKTLEICTDSQRTVLLSRIRGHAHALKKYTYGKHIVARFEQVFGEDNQSST